MMPKKQQNFVAEHSVKQLPPTTELELLSKVKAYFSMGEWKQVVAQCSALLDDKRLDDDETAGLVWAYLAASYLQLNKLEQSRLAFQKIKHSSRAKPKLMRMLLSNCYYNLGRLSMASSSSTNSLDFFIESAHALKVDNCNIVARFRYMNSAFEMGSREAGLHALSEELKLPLIGDESFLRAKQRVLLRRQEELKRLLVENGKPALNDGCFNERKQPAVEDKLVKLIEQAEKPTILVAGMRHCGSTALYNLVRLALNYSGYSVFTGYSERVSVDQLNAKQYDCSLVKIHEVDDSFIQTADLILCPIRDIRDTVASAKRRDFPLFKKMGSIEYSKHNRLLYQAWKSSCNYLFKYERYIKEPSVEVNQLFSFLGISNDFVEKAIKEVNNLPLDKYNETLLSSSHITDKKRELTFFDTLTPSEVEKITSYNLSWLKKYGYE